MYWYKASNTTTIDPTFGLIAKKSSSYKHEVIAVWFHLLEIASRRGEDGYLGEINHEEIDFALELLPKRSMAIIAQMGVVGLIAEGRIKNWNKYQIDPTNAERQRKHRLKKKETTNVTVSNSDITEDNAVTVRLDKNRIEKNTGEIVSQEQQLFLPDKITFEFETIAMNIKLNLEQTKEQYELFKNYYLARPDERIKTYAPLWKNWCIKAFGNYQANRGNNSRNYGRVKQENKPKARDINDPEYIAELKAKGAIV